MPAPTQWHPRPAGVAPRIVAGLIDFAIAGLLLIPAVAVSALITENTRSLALDIVMPLVYSTMICAFATLELFGCATLGKRFVGLAVAGDDACWPAGRQRVARWAVRHGANLLVSCSATMLLVPTRAGAPTDKFDGVRLMIVAAISMVWQIALLVGFCISCFLDRRAFYDQLSDTTVFRAEEIAWREESIHGFPVRRS